ncbi:MAG TPA: 30S ribosomal protein S21 [Gemmatimonadales bacterium]|nr:30S ribosomal protein S21 [Gemmatimonadales bacterium]
MLEITIGEDGRLDLALKAFRRKVQRAGILRELRERRHYLKPSLARKLKKAAARRRKARDRKGRHFDF